MDSYCPSLTYTWEHEATEKSHSMRTDEIKTRGLVTLSQSCKGFGEVGPFHHLRESLDHLDLATLQLVAQFDWGLSAQRHSIHGEHRISPWSAVLPYASILTFSLHLLDRARFHRIAGGSVSKSFSLAHSSCCVECIRRSSSMLSSN